MINFRYNNHHYFYSSHSYYAAHPDHSKVCIYDVSNSTDEEFSNVRIYGLTERISFNLDTIWKRHKVGSNRLRMQLGWRVLRVRNIYQNLKKKNAISVSNAVVILILASYTYCKWFGNFYSSIFYSKWRWKKISCCLILVNANQMTILSIFKLANNPSC